MAGYTRQSLAAIQDGEDIIAAPLNAEFNQLQDAFNAVTGHTHDGTIGNSAKINLTGAAAVTGTLPDANLPTTMGGKTFTSTVTISSGSLTMTANNASMELGSTAGANTPFIDFHSSGNANDFDSRILATGGTASVAQGSLTYTAGGGHNFVGAARFGGTIGKDVDNSLILINGGITSGANIELYGPTHATTPNQMKLDANTTEFRNANGSGTPSVLIGGNTVWHAGNDGAGSGSDMDLLDGQHGSFYQDASNLNAGTIADARLPSTMAGKTFTSTTIQTGTAAIFLFRETDAGPKDWYLVGDGGTFSVRENDTGTTRFRIDPGGNALFTQGLTVSGTLSGVSTAFSGNMFADQVVASGGNFYLRSATDRIIRFQTDASVTRSQVYHHQSSASLRLELYNTSGVFVHGLNIFEGGGMTWSGHAQTIGGNFSTSETQWFTNNTGHSFRVIADNTGAIFFQRSNDRFVANAVNHLTFTSAGIATFSAAVNMPSTLNITGTSQGIEIGARGASNTPFIDFHSGSTDVDYDARIIASGGTGSNGGGTLTLSANSIVTGGNIAAGGSAVYQTDGNVQFTGGMITTVGQSSLASALVARAGLYTGSTTNETVFPNGHTIAMITSSALAIARNASSGVNLHNANTAYYVDPSSANAGTALSGTWRARGVITDAGNNNYYRMQRTA